MRLTTQRNRALRLIAVAAVGSVSLAGMPLALAADAAPSTVEPVVEGLNGPRGLDVGPQRVFYAEADGTVSRVIIATGEKKMITQVPPSFVAPVISRGPGGKLYILTPQGDEGSGGATLYVREHGSHEARVLADIGAYQLTDPDPYDLEDDPTESNPYGVAALEDGNVLVADAAGNDLLKVAPNGDITTVARIKPRVVKTPDGIEGGPPPGTPIPAEGVATSVTVGRDGFYYVGELRGFPATVGTSEIWRISPDASGAVCNPEKPTKGDCTRFADGFTSIVDLAPAPRGGLHVAELVKASWLMWEQGSAEPIGGLFRVGRDGEDRVELAADQLILPGAVDFAGVPYVSGPIFDQGAIVKVVE
jgi:hypothetical protein